MGEKTGISWTDSTFNGWWGCVRVSAACDNCYAATFDKRVGGNHWDTPERRVFGPKHWNEPLKWNRKAEAAGKRHRVFCASMSDVFEDHPTAAAERPKLWDLIRKTPWLDWQLLTKRAPMIAKCLPADWGNGYPNVWLGVTAEDQANFNVRWAYLKKIPAVVRWISYEPMCGPLALPPIEPYPDWYILGGESGSKPRLFDLDEARFLIRRCREEGIAVFVKQLGARAGSTLVNGGEELIKMPKGDPTGAEVPILEAALGIGNVPRDFPTPRRSS